MEKAWSRSLPWSLACAQTIPAPASARAERGGRAKATPPARPAATATPTRTTEPEAPAPAVPDEVWHKRWKVCPPARLSPKLRIGPSTISTSHLSPVIRVAPGEEALAGSSSPDAASLAKLDFSADWHALDGKRFNLRGALWIRGRVELRSCTAGQRVLCASRPSNRAIRAERVKPWLGTAKPKSFSQFVEQLRRGGRSRKSLALTQASFLHGTVKYRWAPRSLARTL